MLPPEKFMLLLFWILRHSRSFLKRLRGKPKYGLLICPIILNRYTFMANYLSNETQIDFSSKIKNKSAFDQIMSQTPTVEQFKNFKLSKTDPVSATVYDILTDVKTSNFIIRPDYQRSEVANNIQKASYLMESIMLGIRIPPILMLIA